MIWNKSKQPADPQQDAAAAPKKGGAAAFAQKNWKWLVPVACVAINGAKNAAILAVQMLGTNCDGCRQKIIDFKAAMAEA